MKISFGQKICQIAFETLKRKLTSVPILAYPNMNKPFILTTDASNSAIGFILSQKDKETENMSLLMVVDHYLNLKEIGPHLMLNV